LTEQIENLLLEHLKKIQAEQALARERDRDMLARITNMDASLVTVMQHQSHIANQISHLQVSYDKQADRIERIERRLELI
jgi:ribosomal protein S24E